MENILIITGRYLPGYKDGGPVRTIKNLTDMYGDQYHFTVACADRDHGDCVPYSNISVGVEKVNHIGKADVVYIENGKYKFSDIKRLVKNNDLIYICGPYNTYAIKSLILNRLGVIRIPFVLAPMGSFSKGALAIKSKKKDIFLSLIKFFGLFKNVSFSVTSEVEKKEMKDALNTEKDVVKDNQFFIAEDPQRSINSILNNNEIVEGINSENVFTTSENVLKVVFLSRISEKKNLIGAAKILSKVKGNVLFHVYGNMEDEEYFSKCECVLNSFPANIKWEYKGEVDSEAVPNVLSQYDVFLFPTHGENFGHVISEALLSGVIPVISDTTPWLDFDEKNAGFVISADDEDAFAKCIDMLCDMSCEDRKVISDNAKNYYKEKYDIASKNSGYIKMFETLICK